MARFSPARQHFGEREPEPEAVEIDEADGLPKPLTTKAAIRRVAGIREAKAVLEHLPGPGESLHAICTARMDLTDVMNALFEIVGPVEKCSVATLGYNAKNLTAIVGWLERGQVKEFNLLSSLFFRAHKADLWASTLEEFTRLGQRAACCHSHAKVVSMTLADGRAMSIEGSANLCGNGSGREQFALFNDVSLANWHHGWICDLIGKHGKGTAT